MKAIVYKKYGSPDVLQFREIEKPVPKENEVLVKIYASSVNAADLDYLNGTFMIRFGGFFKPRFKILGSDIAGIVETIGRNVTQFKPGDEVYGDLTDFGFGAFAEYVAVPEHAIAEKPAGITFEQAAAVPSAGGVAFLNLTAKREIKPGHRVLINGAGGGMGTFAVQIAKSYGAEVTGVDRGGKLDMLRSIGADHVIDYTREDCTENGQQYDLILDVAAHRSIFDYKRSLQPRGIYAMVGGSLKATFQAVVLGPGTEKTDNKMGILMKYPQKDDLIILSKFLESGTVIPVIDKQYSLAETAEALRYLSTGEVKGKVVISVEH